MRRERFIRCRDMARGGVVLPELLPGCSKVDRIGAGGYNTTDVLKRGVAQSGSAQRLGRWGRRFKSSLPDFGEFSGWRLRQRAMAESWSNLRV